MTEIACQKKQENDTSPLIHVQMFKEQDQLA